MLLKKQKNLDPPDINAEKSEGLLVSRWWFPTCKLEHGKTSQLEIIHHHSTENPMLTLKLPG